MLPPHVMNFNLDVAQAKFKDIAIAMGLNVAGLSERMAAKTMIENLYSLVRNLNIQSSLKDKGITEADLDIMVESASKVTRLLDNNPKVVTKSDIRVIHEKIL